MGLGNLSVGNLGSRRFDRHSLIKILGHHGIENKWTD